MLRRTSWTASHQRQWLAVVGLYMMRTMRFDTSLHLRYLRPNERSSEVIGQQQTFSFLQLNIWEAVSGFDPPIVTTDLRCIGRCSPCGWWWLPWPRLQRSIARCGRLGGMPAAGGGSRRYRRWCRVASPTWRQGARLNEELLRTVEQKQAWKGWWFRFQFLFGIF